VGKIKVLAPTVCFKIDFFHEIREYAIFLPLQFVPNLFSRGIVGNINVLAPTGCFKVDSFTTSESMPLFCSYSLYQSGLVDVI